MIFLPYFISLSVILIILLFSGLAISHAIEFQYLSSRTKKLTIFYIILSLVLLIFIFIIFFSINWSFLL